MKMILRTICRSEDSAWTRSFFNSISTNFTSGSKSFSRKYYYSMNLRSFKSSKLDLSWASSSIKAMFDGFDARLTWMEKWT
jgi:hypothetical protein